MGYYQESLTVYAKLSSHNDERDERDRHLWDELSQRIQDVLNDPRYSEITPWV